MLDYFTENIVKRKKSGKDIALSALIAVGAIIVFLALCYIGLITGLMQILFLLAAGAIWGAYILIGRFSIEYEYIVTNGEMDIDKIMQRRKRKRIITVPAKNIRSIEPLRVDNTTYKEVIDASKNDKNAADTYMLITEDNVKIIFNPSEKMLKIFAKFRPQSVKVSGING